MLYALPITLLFLWLESTITVLPLMIIFLSVAVVLYKDTWVFALAFVAGIILDSTAVRPLGSTSIFLICWIFLILLYERKYQIDSYLFIIASSFIGSWAFLTIFGYDNNLTLSGISASLALLLYAILKKVIKYK